MSNSNSKVGTEVPQSTEADVTTSSQTIAKPNVSSSQTTDKDFVQWLTEDALPTTKDILSQLKEINRKRDEAKSWLNENNIPITEDAIQERVNGCC